MNGTVKNWMTDRKTGRPGTFGFIQSAQGPGTDYFVHFQDLASGPDGHRVHSLAVGDRVEFTPVKTDKGWKATMVSRAR